MQYLVELLEKETTVYNSYLELAVKKKKALIENDLEALDLITDQEKKLSTKVLALEAARVEFLREQGYAANVHINEVIEKTPSNERPQLENIAEELKMVLANCKKFHDSNMTLIKQSSNYINHMIKVFSSNLNGGQQAATYTKGAQKFQSGKIADIQG
jgi:flagellar biosynthesis/type III secretory pathway chaperone